MKKIVKYIFNLIDEDDFNSATASIVKADDMSDYTWNLRIKLFRKKD